MRRPAAKVFLILGAAATLGLLAFVLRQLPARDAVMERIAPDYGAVLPAGAEVAGNAVELPALPQSTYVTAYRLDGKTLLAMISWNRNEHRFALASSVDLAEAGAPAVMGTVQLSADTLGKDAPFAVLATGTVGASAEVTFIAVREGNGLRMARVTGRDGAIGAAFFLSGASATRGEEFALGDVDGDGDKDAVQEMTVVDAEGVPHAEASAYLWQDGMFRYDAELSRTLTLRENVFPEAAEESATVDTDDGS